VGGIKNGGRGGIVGVVQLVWCGGVVAWLGAEGGFPPPPSRPYSTLTLSGIPRRAILLRILQASLTSTRWLPRERLLIR